MINESNSCEGRGSDNVLKTVIMAGGRGTRISSVASDIPKPMIEIEGKPVLEHEIEC